MSIDIDSMSVRLVVISAGIKAVFAILYANCRAGAASRSKKCCPVAASALFCRRLSQQGPSNLTVPALPTPKGEDLRMPKIKLNFGRLTIPEKIARTRQVVAALTGNAN